MSLPFGLSSAPWAFTKLLRVVVAFLHKNGLRLVIYLDDILIAADSQSAASARQAVNTVRLPLEALDFVISSEKSSEEPSQLLAYIGLFIDSIKMKLILPDRKRLDILRLCKSALKDPHISRNDLEKIIGNFNWVATAVNFAPAHFRGLQALLNSRPDGRRIKEGDFFSI